jgi:hypothetical protein
VTPEEVPPALTDDTLVFVVRSRWGTTIHRGYSHEVRRRKPQPWVETVIVDHPVCQIGSRALRNGNRAYHASFVGAFKNMPIVYLAEPGIKGLAFCTRCWKGYR